MERLVVDVAIVLNLLGGSQGCIGAVNYNLWGFWRVLWPGAHKVNIFELTCYGVGGV
jgi:hypothetical protein